MLLDHASGSAAEGVIGHLSDGARRRKLRYRRLTFRSERAAPLTCSLRWRSFTLPPAVFASRACVSVRCTTARLISAESSLSGRFGAGALRPVGGEGAHVTVFWRYTERGNDCAQRYAPLRVLLCRVRTGSSMHRFGKPLMMQVLEQPAS